MMLAILSLLLAFQSSYSAEITNTECRSYYDKYDRQALASRNFLFGKTWPRNEIPFMIRGKYSYKDLKVIKSAMQHIERNVCVKWVKYTGQKSYVLIKDNEQGCFATLGYNPHRGQHVLNLERGNGYKTCMIMGIAAHEMFHILGFAHEQTRPDRDHYVKIHWSLIKRNSISNYFRALLAGSKERLPICDPKSQQKSFDKCYSGFRTQTFGYPYDYGSIMHYGLKDFSPSGKNTMDPISQVPVGVVIGNRKAMTRLDALKARAKYNCDGKPTTTRKPSVECKDQYVQCQTYKNRCSFDKKYRMGCPVTCGLCQECFDKFSNCKKYAGLCGGDDQIDEGCHLTCGTC